MSTIIRIAYPGAYYHIINRGLHRQDIYFCDQDKEHFIMLIGEMCLKYNIEVHAYCLLENHFHLTICTPEANISKAIHFLESAYVNRMNVELEREGQFFQGRFTAVLVESEEYLSHLTRYIHLSPVRSRLVGCAKRYPWSSYGAYIGLDEAPKWLVMDIVLAQFDDDMGCYQRFVESASRVVLDNFFTKKKTPLLLGTEYFRSQVERRVRDLPNAKRDQLLLFLRARYSIEQIIDTVTKVLGVSRESLFRVFPRRHNVARLLFIYLCKRKSGLCNRKISDYLQLKSEAAIPLAVRRLSVLMRENREVYHQAQVCMTELMAKEPYNMHEIFLPD